MNRKKTRERRDEDSFLDDKDWITVMKAGFILKQRYLKVRDLAMQGKLGEVKMSTSGRYFVRESSVKTYKSEQDARRSSRSPGTSQSSS